MWVDRLVCAISMKNDQFVIDTYGLLFIPFILDLTSALMRLQRNRFAR